ncbi:MAG: nitrile hydratase subunit alpha [Arenicellales bacterium]|nr:nitrile hydratase subunit alpha [Arenicellales bacterium]
MTENHSHPHKHPLQPDHREPSSYYELMGVALNELLLEKGIYTNDEMRAMIEAIENIDPSTHGAKVVARAWADPEFKTFLLADGVAAVKSIGLDPGYTILTALENTPEVHNVVVCTLCSCYPRALLGRPPVWYKSKEYRARVVREPRSVLREFGTIIADDVEVRVHDSTAELRYIVIPLQPEGSEDMDEEELSKLVTRDSMIGTALARNPHTANP